MRTTQIVHTLLVFMVSVVLAGVAGESAVSAADPPAATELEFVFVKGGCFKMGDTFGVGEENEIPVHDICVNDYSIGKYEVTQGQWQAVMKKNPSENGTCGVDCPVENVSWEAVQEFIGKLNSTSGKKYRLPTEAEWEYAARSGGKNEKWAGTSDPKLMGDYAWYFANSDRKPHPVGTKKPNALGLYDMSGNVWEWCQDGYSESYYRNSPKNNPSGADASGDRTMRGGTFGSDAVQVRTSIRTGMVAAGTDSSVGFRLLLPAKKVP